MFKKIHFQGNANYNWQKQEMTFHVMTYFYI